MILQVVILLSCNMLTCRKLRYSFAHTFVLPLSHTKLHKYYFEWCMFPTNVMLFSVVHEQMATAADEKVLAHPKKEYYFSCFRLV